MLKESIDTIVPRYYYNYGKYVNTEKMFPSIVDGLIPVYRRILLAVHTIAKSKYVKTANAVGMVMGQWHPHMVDKGPFSSVVNNDFIIGDGQWGCNVGINKISPAAERYTKVKASDQIEELAFKYVDYIKWEVGELDHKEPPYLPTMLPFCLMGKNETLSIGVGLKAQIPCYEKGDLIKRLLYILNNRRKHIITPKIQGCRVLSKSDILEHLATTGKGILEIEGKYEVDEKNYIVRIKGWSPRTTFETLIKKIDNYKGWKLLFNRDIGYNDDSTNTTDIRFEVLRIKGKQDIFKRMKESISKSLLSNISYKIYVVNTKHEVILSSVDNILQHSYNFYMLSFKAYLNHSITKLTKEIEELDVISKIRPYLSSALKLKTQDKVLLQLSKDTSIDATKIKEVCSKYRISSLMNVDVNSSKLKNDKIEFEKKLFNIDEEVINNYKDLLKNV